MLNEGHHTLKGIQKIVNIRASLNTGLSDELKEAFPKWKAVSTKDLESTKNNISYSNIHPDWLAGFATGESNFFIAVQKAKTNSGISTSLRFSIAQHSRDLLLLESFINYFGGGFCSELYKTSSLWVCCCKNWSHIKIYYTFFLFCFFLFLLHKNKKKNKNTNILY